MFGRKKDEEEDEMQVGIPAEADAEQAPRIALKPAPNGPRPAGYAPAAAKPEPRKPQEHPRANGGNGNGNGSVAPAAAPEAKRLIVGRDIVLNGAIHSCDKLIVDGRVEASLSDCREMEITETGTFKGDAAVDVALISGHFEGTLVARELLLVRAKGSVSGEVRFARLEVERGGEIEGEVSVVSGEQRLAPSPRPSLGNGAAAELREETVAN
jgi:cytoskeletal protein CcmA (bactofilin family)